MIKHFIYIISIIISIVFLFSSCKIGQKYIEPRLSNMPQNFESIDLKSGNISDIGWSTLYTDTILQEYIKKALEYNKDLLIAVTRIKEMEANKRISFANLFPAIGYGAEAEREHENYGGDAKIYKPEINANVNVSWELDIWGNLRWQNDAGIAAYMQTVEAKRWLQLTIIAQVAQAYFELKSLDKELKIVKQTQKAREEGVRFAKLRYEGGLTSEIPYRQSLVELARTETLIPNLEHNIKLKENDLLMLIGEYPIGRAKRNSHSEMEHLLHNLPIDLPSTLLKRRPDMLQAEQNLIEANAKVGMAFTDMFPKIKISGRIGAENDEFAHFLSSPSWLVNGLITGPIFNMGKNKAKHRAAQAAYERSVLEYEKKVLDVFKEVNNSIVTFHKVKEIRESTEELYESANTNHELSKIQYVNGSIRYIDLLDAQRQSFDAQIALNRAHLNELLSVVNLYKALGGGVME